MSWDFQYGSLWGFSSVRGLRLWSGKQTLNDPNRNLEKGRAKVRNATPGHGIGYTVTLIICDILFGIPARIRVMSFWSQREYRADRGAAQLPGTPRPMIAALHRLGGLAQGGTAEEYRCLGYER